ncbi:UNVERIFIED_CONTAM: hypothetical protein Slati_2481900 [Sesamum latifolium]|uniref:Reverse transcriptase Ty1/copia-type domain-containing protein n=1 Tax=Sesamum latifolium TaxID=2727402 RepID=A0AAW2WE18_9LAMI
MAKSTQILLAIAAWYDYEILQMDVKTSFLNGFIEEEMYMDQLEGFTSVGEEQKKVLKRLNMENLKQGFLPMRHGIKLSKKQSPKTDEELKRMLDISYASAIGSIQYVVQCTRPDVTYALCMTIRYEACTGEAHWSVVKIILKYLKRTKDMFLINDGEELILECYSDASFQSDDDDGKSQLDLYSSLMVVWLLGRVPSRLPRQIPPEKLKHNSFKSS